MNNELVNTKSDRYTAHFTLFKSFVASALMVGMMLLSTPLGANSADYAEHTPGSQHLAEGMRAYNAGHYGTAKAKFQRAAHWADKLAQFNIGVMHYHGQGVPQDSARAWAWFKLSAERGYPEMVNTADQIFEELDQDQRAVGEQVLNEELLPDFGDSIAIERTARRMERQRRQATGSRTGFVRNMVVIDQSGRNRTGDDFYRAEAWDFRQIIALEARLFRAMSQGTVTLGDLEIIEDDGDE